MVGRWVREHGSAIRGGFVRLKSASYTTRADVYPYYERFMSHVRVSSAGCWDWVGPADKDGYGYFYPGRVTMRAHRVSILLFSCDVIPRQMSVCHRCDHPVCVNPDHLFLGTTSDNNADAHRKGRSARGNGHGARLHPERLARGENHGRARWTIVDVRAMRAMHEAGASCADIAASFSTRREQVWAIVTRKAWGHVA